jgi:hypothetical protein
MVSYGSDEALGLGPQLEEADGRGDGLREDVGLGLGFWLGCQDEVGLGLGLVEGVGATDEEEGSGTGVTVCPLELGDGDALGVLVVNGSGVSEGSGTLAIAGVTVIPIVAAAISDKTTDFSFNSSPPSVAQLAKNRLVCNLSLGYDIE